MRLVDWIDEHDGIRHVDDALGAGYTRYAIRRAVERGTVSRIRRWLVTTTARVEHRRAASISGRIACISAAREHGLWTIDDGRFHVAVAHGASRFDAGDAVVHWGAGPVDPHRFELVEPVVNAMLQLADCQPLENALATWESALRTGTTTLSFLERLPLRSAAARRVLAGASQLSDSGIETIPVARLRRIGIVVRQQVLIDGHRVNGLIGERLVLQIDGYDFHRTAAQRRADIAHDRRLTLMGYTVLRFDYRQVLFEWDTIEAEVRHAMAIGLHSA